MDKKDIIINHKADIRKRASEMKDRSDFLQLLNYVCALEIGDGFKPFSEKQLRFFCDSNKKNEKRYRSFKIPKKNGKQRIISAPVKGLKSMLKALNIIFECLYSPSVAAMGFTMGRSIVDNAYPHVGMNYVLNLDLKDFFPSISQARIWARLQLKPFSFPKEIANVAAGLCCMCMEFADETGKKRKKGVLPQGAPTSPILTNAVCDKLDRRLLGLAKRFNVKYSRYADDITFSSMHSVYAAEGEFMTELRRIIEEQNFTINEEKTRLQKRGARQEVTGIIVCEKPNVTRNYIRDIRMLLHVWEKFGHDRAYARFLPNYIANKLGATPHTPSMEEVLRGKIMYVKMVKGEGNPVYKALSEQFNALMERDSEEKVKETKKPTDLIYAFSYPLCQFEDAFKTKLSFKKKRNGKPYATFVISEKEVFVALSTTVEKVLSKKDPEKLLSNKRLVISLAKSEGRSFWIIRFPAVSSKAEELTLNIPVDELLRIWKEKDIDAAIAANNGVELDSISDEKPLTIEHVLAEHARRFFLSKSAAGSGAGNFPRLVIEEPDLADFAKGLDQKKLDDNSSSDFTPLEDSE